MLQTSVTARRLGLGVLLLVASLMFAPIAGVLATPLSPGAAAPPVFVQDGPEADDEDEFPPVPAEVLARYLEVVQKSDFFTVTQALRDSPESGVRKALADWGRELGITVDATRINSLNLLEEREFRLGSGDAAQNYSLQMESLETGGVEVPIFVLFVEGEDDEVEYRVAPRQMAALRFPMVSEVRLVHPLNRPLKQHAVTNRPLTAVVGELAGLAGVDYVIESRLAGASQITYQLHDRRIRDAIELAAMVAGWSVTYVNTADRDEDTNAPDDAEVDFEEALELYAGRKWHNVMRPLETQEVKTPLDALHTLVTDAATLVKQQRYVVTLLPEGPENHDDGEDDD